MSEWQPGEAPARWSWRLTAAGGLTLVAVVAALSWLSASWTGTQPGDSGVFVRGVVRNEEGVVEGAVVRIQTTDTATRTDEAGRFELRVPKGEVQALLLTAWAKGHYCAGPFTARGGDEGLELPLRRHATRDHPDYTWAPSVDHASESTEPPCVDCHSREGTDLAFPLPVDEWRLDAHARSARNPRFLSMYLGQDVSGRKSPPTRFVERRDYGRVPLRPDPTLPDRGPGFRLDTPDAHGTCAACHAPAAAMDAPYDTDPSRVTGVEAEGHPCDFCHKVWKVLLDEESGLPHPNAHGVLSLELRRPPSGEKLFFGPFDDVAPGDDACSPLQRESRFCAPCHHAQFWGTVVYDSYGEWLRSSFSDPVTGRTCQDCHMPPRGDATHFARPDRGGLARDPQRLASHRMPGADDVALLSRALDLEVDAVRRGDELSVHVILANRTTGHHVPTGSPLRHLILLVRATDASGRTLVRRRGPTVPSWCGVGRPERRCYAGLPGKAFAKVLEEVWTGAYPTASYWNPTRIRSDNRIAAGATDESRYVFEAPATGPVTVDVRLLFRRAFLALAEKKGWDDPDLLMAHEVLRVRPGE